jgi:hypothetical protein
MIPAVANGVAFPLTRPSDGDTKNVVFGIQPYPVTIDGFQVVTTLQCVVIVDGSPSLATAAPPVTVTAKVNGEPLVVVGSLLTLPSGHVGPVPPQAGAGPAVSVT